MLYELDASSLGQLKNPSFRRYAEIYTRIYEQFMQRVQADGLEFDENLAGQAAEAMQRLRSQGAIFRNADKSVYINRHSPACEACRQGVGSASYFLSLKCHRNCYYCFNPNQDDYGRYALATRDCIQELAAVRRSGGKLTHIALTGGEPLLHKQETIAFFRCAEELFHGAHTRLYTSGDLLDEASLEALRDAGLDEIRFSIKLEDREEDRSGVIRRVALAQRYIPRVMVEMPVIPDTVPEMKRLLRTLNGMGIFGINLLEFCFPLHNAAEFRQRSFKLKNPPFRVLYDYWYAGGLPVSRSELGCLELLEFALEEKMSLGVHYCSVENKHSGQIFRQNSHRHGFGRAYLSPRDFFLKTAKVFGEDIEPVLSLFKKRRFTRYQRNENHDFLEFPVQEIATLKKLDIEIGISSSVVETRDGESCLRELKIELTRPEDFSIREI